MRKKVLEGSILFVSVVKWLFLASCAGVAAGLASALFLKLLAASIVYAQKFPYYFALLPLALVLSGIITKYLAPEAAGGGTGSVIEAVHKHSGKMKLMAVPVKLVVTILTVATGGSAGKEGPCAQIGAGVCSALSDLLKFDARDRKKLVICGISAGFAAVFGTPIAGAIYGVEVLFIGALMYDVLLPSFVAGVVGFQVASSLGITYFHDPVNFVPLFSSMVFIKVCIGGIFFGLCSLLFVEMLRLGEWTNKRIKLWEPLKGAVGGVTLVILALIFSTKYMGLGLDTMASALQGDDIPPGAFLLKMLFTSVTLNFGGSGGLVTPTYFIGATAGNVFGQFLGFDPALFAAIGMVSLLAGASNTPISASIMAVELFGPEVGSYAAVSCIISFLMSGHRSMYPNQVLSTAKSQSLVVESGREMGDIDDVGVKLRPNSVAGQVFRGYRKVQKKTPPRK
ncbi:MAG: chloride channel protein [Nitrospirota bacterium]|nr:chloride channel protein [Nitrospirota bacterium]